MQPRTRSRSVRMPDTGVWTSIRLSKHGARQWERIRARRFASLSTAGWNSIWPPDLQETRTTGSKTGSNQMREPLLSIRDLTVQLRSSADIVLDGISLDVDAGESIGIVGESGAGKTTLAKAVVRLLSPQWSLKGSIQFRGVELTNADERQLQRIRGAQISSIFQEPELALNPVLTAGRQIDEVLRAHSTLDQRCREQAVLSMLTSVGLDPQIYHAFPHQLSGGQRQRVVIAQSLISKPSLLIADEPTSALDNVTQAAVLEVLQNLKHDLRLALVFITHNPALLSGLADRVLVLHAGRIVETGTFEQVYWNPSHSYTQEMIRSIPPLPGEFQLPRTRRATHLTSSLVPGTD